MAKRSAYELLEHYYQTLSFLLPMKDSSFVEDLFKHDLLMEDFKPKLILEALSTNKERASLLLDVIVRSELVEL